MQPLYATDSNSNMATASTWNNSFKMTFFNVDKISRKHVVLTVLGRCQEQQIHCQFGVVVALFTA